MPRVADYSIVSDAGVIEANQSTINFEVPASIDGGSRSILTFMIKVGNVGPMSLKVRINGTQVWSWSVTDDSDYPKRFWQEVIPAGVLKPGTNVFSFDSSGGIARFVEMSDVVVWWQANI